MLIYYLSSSVITHSKECKKTVFWVPKIIRNTQEFWILTSYFERLKKVIFSFIYSWVFIIDHWSYSQHCLKCCERTKNNKHAIPELSIRQVTHDEMYHKIGAKLNLMELPMFDYFQPPNLQCLTKLFQTGLRSIKGKFTFLRRLGKVLLRSEASM